jgi:hypothetical protein
MTRKEQADVYKQAAIIVAAMDPRTQWRLPPGISCGNVGRSYSEKEAAMWDGFGAAARVLLTVASQFDVPEQS